MVRVENIWRDTNCPWLERLVDCPRPEPCYECPDAMSCDDIRIEIVILMEELD
jgi:hypothetical protein